MLLLEKFSGEDIFVLNVLLETKSCVWPAALCILLKSEENVLIRRLKEIYYYNLISHQN